MTLTINSEVYPYAAGSKERGGASEEAARKVDALRLDAVVLGALAVHGPCTAYALTNHMNEKRDSYKVDGVARNWTYQNVAPAISRELAKADREGRAPRCHKSGRGKNSKGNSCAVWSFGPGVVA